MVGKNLAETGGYKNKRDTWTLYSDNGSLNIHIETHSKLST